MPQRRGDVRLNHYGVPEAMVDEIMPQVLREVEAMAGWMAQHPLEGYRSAPPAESLVVPGVPAPPAPEIRPRTAREILGWDPLDPTAPRAPKVPPRWIEAWARSGMSASLGDPAKVDPAMPAADESPEERSRRWERERKRLRRERVR
jgi:hypothetical protein